MNGRYLPPTHEPLQSTEEDFDLEQMPPGHGDLNYRVPLILATNQAFWTVLHWSCAAVVAFPCAFLFRDLVGGYLLDLRICLVALLFALIAGLVQALIPAQDGDAPTVELRMVTWFLMPIVAWATVALASVATSWQGVVVYVAAVPIPVTILIADQIATHAVWWMSANPRLDLATMLAWRDDWRKRFVDPPGRGPRIKNLARNLQDQHEQILRAKRHYRLGAAFVICCIAAGALAAFLFSRSAKPYEIGFTFFIGFFVALLASTLVRCWALPGAFGRLWFFLLAWTYAAPDRQAPSWIFRSPTLPSIYRTRLVFFGVFSWALALTMLTDHFAWFFFVDSDPSLWPRISGSSASENAFVFLSVRPGIAFSFSYVVLALLACILFPVLTFLLVLHLLAGPVIGGHFLALEDTDAYEQR